MGKRLRWKTIHLTSTGDMLRLQGTWDSSYMAWGKGRTFRVFHGQATIETNLPAKAIRELFRFAGVRCPKDWLWDDKPGWAYETDDTEG